VGSLPWRLRHACGQPAAYFPAQGARPQSQAPSAFEEWREAVIKSQLLKQAPARRPDPIVRVDLSESRWAGTIEQALTDCGSDDRPTSPLLAVTGRRSQFPTGRAHTTPQWYNALMGAIVPRNVGFYSYAGTDYANPHAVTSVGGTTYTYDNNGNVNAIGSLDYTWDWRNRLASAERSGGGITSYGYDHTGQRVFQATGSATTSYPNRYYNVASSSLTATTTKHSSRRMGRSWRRSWGAAPRMPPLRTFTPTTSAARTWRPMRTERWCNPRLLPIRLTAHRHRLVLRTATIHRRGV
jgi:hypothetical protein